MSISFEFIDERDINNILINLSKSENINLIDLLKNEETNVNNKKNKKLNKKELFISSNKVRINTTKLNKDKERIEYFKHISNFNDQLYDELLNFDTEEGKCKFKFKLLKLAYKNKNKTHIINLYLQLQNYKPKSKKDTKLMNKITKYMNKLDYKTMQFRDLSNQLYPLDFYNEYEKKLDTWQLDVIKLLDKNKSVLVTAPTSCGKTWLSVYPVIKDKKVLFIAPTDALVLQVASLFTKFNYIPSIITENWTYGNNKNLVISTPDIIEDNLYKIGTDFDIIIIDEIHNLNNLKLGHYYERLLKIFADKQILGLSATIKNPEKVLKWLKSFNKKDFQLISYNTRFLNLQRQVFINNKLIKLHPISCINKESINKEFLTKNLPMTPYDCIKLYDSLYDLLPDELEEININKIFPGNNKRLSLYDSHHYENILKDKLIDIFNNNEPIIDKLLDNYRIDTEEQTELNLYKLFKSIKNNNLLPCIIFQENVSYCKEIFSSLVNYLEKLESLNYPYYYENLEFKQKHYITYRDEIINFKKNIKLGKDITNPETVINDMVEKKSNELLKIYIIKFKSHFNKQIIQINKSDVSSKIKKVQVNNLEKELDQFITKPSIKYTDVFRKHSNFCLNYDNPMTADKIRTIKKIISKKLDINVSYTNTFMQGLKRGIGIYTKHMPPAYNMIVQELAQKGDLGFVIADDRLALGINMPFRSSCILGYKDSVHFKKSNYIQMIGRAGRRGKDSEGHIIYCNVDWKSLMKSDLPEINTKYVHIPCYNVINKLTDSFISTSDNIFKYILDTDYNIDNMPNNYDNTTTQITNFNKNNVYNKVIWKLRLYNNDEINKLCSELPKLDVQFRSETSYINSKLLLESIFKYIYNKEYNKKITTVLDIMGNNNVNNYLEYSIFYETMLCLKKINNALIQDTTNSFSFIQNHIAYTFNIMLIILNKSNNLN